jgi:hypothetical protein
MTNRVTEESTVVGFIGSNAGTAGTFLSDAVSLDSENGRRFLADIVVGTIGSSATVDAKFRWSATSGGTYADVTGTAMAQDITGSRVDTIETTAEYVKATYPTANYIKLQVITAVAATPFGAVIRGYDGGHKPPSAGTDQGTVTVVG